MRRRYFFAQGAPEVGQEPVPPVPEPSAEPVPKSGKKLFILIGIVAVAMVVMGSVFILSTPPALGATIPYGYSYTVGQTFTYSISITESADGQQGSATGTGTIQVASFDGENYTFNEAANYNVNGALQSYSFTIVTNKAGQVVNYSNLPSNEASLYSMIEGSPGYGLCLNTPQIRVGETYHIPINLGNSTFSLNGTVNYKVANIENTTVPAGTYKTFKLQFSTSNFQGTEEGVTATASLSGQVIDEYSTCNPIEFTEQGSASAEGQTVNIKASMTLISETG